MFEPKYGVAPPSTTPTSSNAQTDASAPTETTAGESSASAPPPPASPASPPPTDDSNNEITTQVKAKEALVRSKLKDQLGKLKNETMRLNKVQQILGSLEAEQQADIDEIRRRIDEADR
jgi:hypothetical protein